MDAETITGIIALVIVGAGLVCFVCLCVIGCAVELVVMAVWAVLRYARYRRERDEEEEPQEIKEK
jgi:hypothetical protein